jgi:hypothetical protein
LTVKARGCNSHGGYLDEGETLITIFYSKELVSVEMDVWDEDNLFSKDGQSLIMSTALKASISSGRLLLTSSDSPRFSTLREGLVFIC